MSNLIIPLFFKEHWNYLSMIVATLILFGIWAYVCFILSWNVKGVLWHFWSAYLVKYKFCILALKKKQEQSLHAIWCLLLPSFIDDILMNIQNEISMLVLSLMLFWHLLKSICVYQHVAVISEKSSITMW